MPDANPTGKTLCQPPGTPRCYCAFRPTFHKSIQVHPKCARNPSAKYSRDVQLRLPSSGSKTRMVNLSQSQTPHPVSPVSNRTREGDEPASPLENSGESVSGDESSKSKESTCIQIKEPLMSLGGGTETCLDPTQNFATCPMYDHNGLDKQEVKWITVAGGLIWVVL
ncbi:hypothetical protein EV360DRAFT_77103 [Lentinula raphanica]|nr:hypothetical protein EV360DRAFT_77103 [Lentinula raphanica]